MEFDVKENPKASDSAEIASDAQANPETTKGTVLEQRLGNGGPEFRDTGQTRLDQICPRPDQTRLHMVRLYHARPDRIESAISKVHSEEEKQTRLHQPASRKIK